MMGLFGALVAPIALAVEASLSAPHFSADFFLIKLGLIFGMWASGLLALWRWLDPERKALGEGSRWTTTRRSLDLVAFLLWFLSPSLFMLILRS